jgi:hypothetical protein
MVEAGGGEVAWIDAAAVGAPSPRAATAAPAPAPTRAAPVESAPSAELIARPAPPPRKTAFALAVAAGASIYERRFVSDGTQQWSSWRLDSDAVAVAARLRFDRAFGRHGLLAIDGGYRYVGAAAGRWRAPDGTTPIVHLQQHSADAGVALGLRFAALGGLTLRARVGGRFDADLLDGASLPLPSDRLLGLTAGLELLLPRLATISGHPLGLRLFGDALVYGSRNESIDDGRDAGSWGVKGGGSLVLGLWESERGRVSFAAEYAYDITRTHFSGASQRDPSASHADLGIAQHLVTASLAWAY